MRDLVEAKRKKFWKQEAESEQRIAGQGWERSKWKEEGKEKTRKEGQRRKERSENVTTRKCKENTKERKRGVERERN